MVLKQSLSQSALLSVIVYLPWLSIKSVNEKMVSAPWARPEVPIAVGQSETVGLSFVLQAAGALYQSSQKHCGAGSYLPGDRWGTGFSARSQQAAPQVIPVTKGWLCNTHIMLSPTVSPWTWAEATAGCSGAPCPSTWSCSHPPPGRHHTVSYSPERVHGEAHPLLY